MAGEPWVVCEVRPDPFCEVCLVLFFRSGELLAEFATLWCASVDTFESCDAQETMLSLWRHLWSHDMWPHAHTRLSGTGTLISSWI